MLFKTLVLFCSIASALLYQHVFDARCAISSNSTGTFFSHSPSDARFGLRQEYTWQTLLGNLSAAESITGQPHRLVLLSRHGEGFHNVAEARFGSEAWDAVWSKLNGSADGLVWGPDANLTVRGKQQAIALRDRLEQDLPQIGAWLASPLSRALETASILSGNSSIRVYEALREVSGVHTCDWRSTRSELARRFPWADLHSLSEQDRFWSADERETDAHVQQRAVQVAKYLLLEEARVLSVTSHSGFIRNFLLAAHRAPYSIGTAGLVPLVLTYAC